MILVLLELHCKICYTESPLQPLVEALIEKFIRGSSGSLAKRALRSFAFDESSPAATDGFLRTHPDVDIVVQVKGEQSSSLVGVTVRRETYLEEKVRESTVFTVYHTLTSPFCPITG